MGLNNAAADDWVIVSDIDEIPNLNNVNFKELKNKLLFFKQDMMYYKFNLKYDNFVWVGSKACKKKNLVSPQWLRNIKDKNYPWWRLDTYFSKLKVIHHEHRSTNIISNRLLFNKAKESHKYFKSISQ